LNKATHVAIGVECAVKQLYLSRLNPDYGMEAIELHKRTIFKYVLLEVLINTKIGKDFLCLSLLA